MNRPGDVLESGHIVGPPGQPIRMGLTWIDPADLARAAGFGWEDTGHRGIGPRFRTMALVRRQPPKGARA